MAKEEKKAIVAYAAVGFDLLDDLELMSPLVSVAVRIPPEDRKSFGRDLETAINQAYVGSGKHVVRTMPTYSVVARRDGATLWNILDEDVETHVLLEADLTKILISVLLGEEPWS